MRSIALSRLGNSNGKLIESSHRRWKFVQFRWNTEKNGTPMCAFIEERTRHGAIQFESNQSASNKQ